MYVPRLLKRAVDEAVKNFPAVLITGPRQSGKTTFLLREFGDRYTYVSFDDPLEREFALSDPRGFLSRFRDKRVILDEVQYVSQLFPYLKMEIDRKRHLSGRFLLTGSQQFQLMSQITESLAGRVALLELLPFSFSEIRNLFPRRTLEEHLWLGGYPEVALYPEKRDLWVRSYLQTYLERDVRQLQNIRELKLFETFIRLLAALHGQELNYSRLAAEVGVSVPTIKSWISVLEASYIVCLLPPFYRNLRKRVVKRPRFYFLDSALVCTLTRLPSPETALSGPLGGPLFEGWVVCEALKLMAHLGLSPDLYYFRTRQGLEVDLILPLQGKLYPVEIKLTATPTPRHWEPLRKFRELAGKEAGEGVLVCQVEERRPLPQGNLALPWFEFPLWLEDKLRSG